MTETCCVVCDRPMPDQAYADTHCGITKPTGWLDTIADMTPAARGVALGQDRSGQGGGSGRLGSRMELNLGVTAKLDAVQSELTGWVRHIAGERGLHIPARTVSAASDVIVDAAEWLQGHLGWLRHRREVTEALSGFEACARVVKGIARGPSEQKYLGPCGATVSWTDDGTEIELDEPCTGNVFAPVGAEKGACRTCKARWATAERQEWLDDRVRGEAFSAKWISEAYGLNVKTIRTWASRPRPDTGEPPLASYWRTDAGLVTPWIDTDDQDELDTRGPRLHYVGDVLDLAAADAARRAGEQAKRARRAADKAEEASDAA